MRDLYRRWGRWTGCALLAGATALGAGQPAQAQGGGITIPQWIQDSASTSNTYLRLFNYFTSSEVTKFEIWNQEGDPESTTDNFFINLINNNGTIEWVSPWGSRLFSAPHPPFSQASPDQRPFTNLVTLRVDDAASTGGFKNLGFPGDGTALLNPPTPSLPRRQGFFAPYSFEGGELEVTQKLQFARDLVRIEYIIQNRGTRTRRAGIRLLLDPFVDYSFFRRDTTNPQRTRSLFLPQTRQRIFFEADFGDRTGTPTIPRDRNIPESWEIYDDDEGPNPNYIAKAILTGNGATKPTRFVVANTLNLFGTEGAWDYSVDRPMELRISDIGTLVYWDPVVIAPGATTSFVTYAGVGVATHGMSDFYLQDAPRNVQPPFGFVSAVQSPFALPLINGDADTTAAKVSAYIQNTSDLGMPNPFAFLEVPEGLELVDPSQSLRADMPSLSSVGTTTAPDEGKGEWQLRATGSRAGLLPLRVTFGNGFGDSAQVTRHINVPQGRRFILTGEYQMLTFPFNFAALQDDPAKALGLDDPGDPQVVVLRYDPQLDDYVLARRIIPGQSYWVKLLGLQPGESFPVRLENASPIKLSVGDAFPASLKRGWNQVGNPSPYAVPVRELSFLTNRGRLSFEQATARGLIRSTLFEYDATNRVYRVLNRDSVVQPGRGIWVFANFDRVMLWPAPQGPKLSITP